KAMLKQLMQFCDASQVNIQVSTDIKGGATDNLAALKDNEVSAAFLHSDVIYAFGQGDPDYQNYYTLAALYPEEIHVVALRNSGKKTGGHFGIGQTDVVFNSLGDLRGYTVGAAGGSAVTAKILGGQGDGGFQVHAFDTGAEVIPALDSGQIQAAIF